MEWNLSRSYHPVGKHFAAKDACDALRAWKKVIGMWAYNLKYFTMCLDRCVCAELTYTFPPAI